MKCSLILIFVISCISFSDACSCWLPVGWQWDSIWNSAYVGTFTVTGPATSCGMMKVCYPITPGQQFLGAPVAPEILETNSDSAACGVWLEPGRTYFIATDPISPLRISAYLCGLLDDWTDKTCCEMIAEAKKYTGPKPQEPILIDPVKKIE